MKLNWIDRLGDWNPQLLRELKGQLKLRNLLIAGTISLLGQFLLFMYFQAQLPNIENIEGVSTTNKYCTGNLGDFYDVLRNCLQDELGNFVINWQLWWLDLFIHLSLIGIFALLVAGTYMLISNLATEERRDTLNFIRLSPQSPESILVGKLLGVPILLYLVAGLAVPLHLRSGLAAQIPLGLIFSFYGVLIAGCLFFYSAALLFGLVSSWMGGFQAWLGSGTVLYFLGFTLLNPIPDTPVYWLNLFSPSLILHYPVSATGIKSQFESYLQIKQLQWFYLPLGTSTVGAVGFGMLNYGLWTFWSWQALKRRFSNPSKTMLSKRQSYLLVACFEVVLLGFASVAPTRWNYWRVNEDNFIYLLGFNLVLFLGLIVALTPHRQALQDWARYRRQPVSSRKVWNSLLVRDLIWGEKSPALVAIAVNLGITSAILVPWILLELHGKDKLLAFLSLVITLTLTLIYAAIVQLMVFTRTQKQVWIAGTLGAIVLLPPIVLRLLSFHSYITPDLWLFTAFPWMSIKHASATTVFLSLLGQWSILTLLTLQMTRQLRRSGESATIALFAGRSSLPSDVD